MPDYARQPRGEGAFLLQLSCRATADVALEQIWALAIGAEEKVVVSGGADSVITFWEDVTVTEELERIAEHEDQVLKCVFLPLAPACRTDAGSFNQGARL